MSFCGNLDDKLEHNGEEMMEIWFMILVYQGCLCDYISIKNL